MLKLITYSLLLFIFSNCSVAQHPTLLLTKKEVAEIKSNYLSAPLFVETLNSSIAEVDKLISDGVIVPVPKDMAGGYSHEVHKRNFLLVPQAGAIYQITGDEKYAKYVKDVFLAYAALYPTIGKHPSDKSYSPGKLFWQCLNDANWLVYMSQAYDSIYEYLSSEERATIESQLLRPFADFISIENPKFYNRVHNHSTWGNAAVGMLALVLDDDDLLQRALYGLPIDKSMDQEFDNDGGYINIPGQNKAGFYAQLDNAFSPDGYYEEGPYYQRYAMSPFILFAQAIQNNKPELKIFEYRDDLLKKALFTLINLSDSDGTFYPINDAQKGMSYKSRSLISAVDAIYNLCGRDPQLLSIAEEQGKVQLDYGGYIVAKDIATGKLTAFKKQATAYTDGADGKSGGVAILRGGNERHEISCLFKYASQGMGHGHFDRLGYSLYDDNTEILQDYGAARWVNIDQKAGGRYLKENNTWAKQSIAHNAIVINETSHFSGDIKQASITAPDLYYFKSNDSIQVVSAKEYNAYPNTTMHRTLVLLNAKDILDPIFIDITKVNGDSISQIDLPFQFAAQLMESSIPLNTFTENLEKLGTKYGYNHIWKEAEGDLIGDQFNITWYNQNKFFTSYALSDNEDILIFGRIGADDPEFNLRRDALYIHRKLQSNDALFVNAIKSHGKYSAVEEISIKPYADHVTLTKILDNRAYTIISVKELDNEWLIKISNQDNIENKLHNIKVNDTIYEWRGKIEINKI
jgi:hypothetical protein